MLIRRFRVGSYWISQSSFLYRNSGFKISVFSIGNIKSGFSIWIKFALIKDNLKNKGNSKFGKILIESI